MTPESVTPRNPLTPFDAVAFLREHGLNVHSEDGLSGIEFQTELRQIVEQAFTAGWQVGREAAAQRAEEYCVFNPQLYQRSNEWAERLHYTRTNIAECIRRLEPS